mmetsp:Transcript_2572/g.10769  ORF Transcript_2572/g.10769 Transcript_2572/m.10769 type:complete len:1170 (-) Transcript_2572:68-3577(-)
MWGNLRATMDNASALVSDAVGELGQRLDNALAAIDEDVRIAMEGSDDDGSEVSKAMFYRDQLLDFQMEQIRLTREYQALVIEKDNDISKLKAALEGKGDGAEIPAPPVEGSVEALQLELEVLKTTGVTWEKKLRNLLIERNEAAARANRADQRLQELEEKSNALQEQVALHAEVMENFASDKANAHTAKEVDEQTIDGLVDDYSRLAAEAQEKEEGFQVKIQSLENQNEELKLKNRVLELNITELMSGGTEGSEQAAGEQGASDKLQSERELRRQVLQLQMELCDKEREISGLQKKAETAASDARTAAALDYQGKATDAEERAEKLEQRLREAEQAGEALGQRLAEVQCELDDARSHPKTSAAPPEDLLTQLEALRTDVKAKDTEIASLRDSRPSDEATERLARYEKDAEAAKTALEEMARKKDQAEEAQQSLRTEYEAQLSSLRADLEVKEDAMASLKAAQAENGSEAASRIETLTEDSQRLSTEVAQLKKQKVESEEKIKRLESDLLSSADQLEKDKASFEATIASMGTDQSSALQEAIAHAKEETRAEVQRAADEVKEAELAALRSEAEEKLARDLQNLREANELAAAKLAEDLESEREKELKELEEKLSAESAARAEEARSATRKECEAEALAHSQALQAAFDGEKKALEDQQLALQKDHEQHIATLTEAHASKTAELQAGFEMEKRGLEDRLTKEREEALAEEAARADAEKKELVAKYEKTVAEIEAACQKAKDDLENVEVRWRKLQADALEAQRIALQKEHQEELRRVEADRQEWEDLYKRENQRRKVIHNKLMELQGNIRVMCRTRPILQVEQDAGAEADVTSFTSPEDICITREDGMRSRFEFDRVFQQASSQVEVFEAVEPLVTSLLDGYNVCIFAYGQTGSGKTYTMEGPGEDPGVNLRALQTIFGLRRERESDVEYRFKISMLEIYNEQVRDLLETAEDRERPDEPRKLDIRQSAKGNVVPGLTEIEVNDVSAIQGAMARGARNRAVGGHNMNERSSRSHSIVRVRVLGRNLHTGEETRSKLHLIDLAGSERISKTDATGDRLKEAQNINRSLSALGDVIAALASRNKGHVPYRNSKLTYLLQDSLGGNSKVMMFVNISPAVYNVGETLCSLNFAARCRAVELGSATRNVESGSPGSAAGAKDGQRRGGSIPRSRSRK